MNVHDYDLHGLATFVCHRDMIRADKESGRPPPWTCDPVLAKYRFCNVRRMDDKVSRWLLQNWYEPYKDHPNMFQAVALARLVNLPATLDLLTGLVFRKGKPDWDRVKKEMRARKANGNLLFNAAYVIPGNRGADKVEAVVDHFIPSLARVIVNPKSMRLTHRDIVLKGYGVKSFLAGQIVADLRWAVSGSWEDTLTWAPMGPGSARGLARVKNPDGWSNLASLYVRGKVSWLADFQSIIVARLPSFLPDELDSRLEAMDYQNCLCEYDKYQRAVRGEGTPKQLYRWVP